MNRLNFFFILALFFCSTVQAQTNTPITVSTQADTLLFLGLIPFLPAALLLMTGFTRILIVLSLLRHAIGLQTTPPNQIIIGLALILTVFVMQPTMTSIYEDSITPWRNGSITAFEAIESSVPHLREFMEKQVRKETLDVFYANQSPPDKLSDIPLLHLTGAFALSELKTGFEIGVLIFIPFLIIDLIVASVLMSLGMMMLSPALISLPLKILIFVLIDGWSLIAGGLIGSFS